MITMMMMQCPPNTCLPFLAWNRDDHHNQVIGNKYETYTELLKAEWSEG